MPASSPAVLSYKEASHYLGIKSVGAFRNMVYRGNAPKSISYNMRDRRFRVADLDAWVAKKFDAARAEDAHVAEQVVARPKKRGRPTKAESIARRRGMK
jgi:predicted DNA-binding transcriptional regulator AlpA